MPGKLLGIARAVAGFLIGGPGIEFGMHDASEMPEAPEPGAAAELSEKISAANERGEGKHVAVSVTISILSIVSALLLIVSQRAHTEASLLERCLRNFLRVFCHFLYARLDKCLCLTRDPRHRPNFSSTIGENS